MFRINLQKITCGFFVIVKLQQKKIENTVRHGEVSRSIERLEGLLWWVNFRRRLPPYVGHYCTPINIMENKLATNHPAVRVSS